MLVCDSILYGPDVCLTPKVECIIHKDSSSVCQCVHLDTRYTLDVITNTSIQTHSIAVVVVAAAAVVVL